MLTEEFKRAKPILEKLEEHQFEAYFVGGCVRDLLLKRPITDIDITTSARPEEVQKIFSNVIPVGIEHGTVIVRYRQESYEVTTFRTDGTYSDSRHPDDVEFIRSIEKDLERRDFTMNALAMNKEGKMIDLFGGREDLDKKIIRTVGNSSTRFKEDALRIIRGLRFSSQLGFQIESNTFEAMITLKKSLLDISVERITNEMELFFAGNAVTSGLNYLKQAEIDTVLPVFMDHPELIKQLPATMIPLQTFAEVIAYFHYIYPTISIATWTREWKCSNKTKRTAKKLVQDLFDYEQNNLDKIGIYQLKTEHFPLFIRLVDILMEHKINLTRLQQLKRELPIQSRAELAVNGNDILQLFPKKKSGPWVKEALELIEKAVVTGKVDNREDEIKEWLMCKQAEIN